MQSNAATIDVDAIPLDLPVQQAAAGQPVMTVYLATVETLPDGRAKVMAHCRGPVWQWFTVRRPTLAHVPQGRADSKGTSSDEPGRDTGQRGALGAKRGVWS